MPCSARSATQCHTVRTQSHAHATQCRRSATQFRHSGVASPHPENGSSHQGPKGGWLPGRQLYVETLTPTWQQKRSPFVLLCKGTICATAQTDHFKTNLLPPMPAYLELNNFVLWTPPQKHGWYWYWCWYFSAVVSCNYANEPFIWFLCAIAQVDKNQFILKPLQRLFLESASVCVVQVFLRRSKKRATDCIVCLPPLRPKQQGFQVSKKMDSTIFSLKHQIEGIFRRFFSFMFIFDVSGAENCLLHAQLRMTGLLPRSPLVLL